MSKLINSLKTKIYQYKEKKYWKNREILWEDFKIRHNDFVCGLVKETSRYTPTLWEYDCCNCCYNKDFFDKYGCMYIKDFMEY